MKKKEFLVSILTIEADQLGPTEPLSDIIRGLSPDEACDLMDEAVLGASKHIRRAMKLAGRNLTSQQSRLLAEILLAADNAAFGPATERGRQAERPRKLELVCPHQQ